MTRRRIVRPPRSTFKVGQLVTVEGGSSGDYFGRVSQVHGRLTKPVSSYEPGNDTRPGVTVQVTRWEGVDYLSTGAFAPFDIVAWDSETTRQHHLYGGPVKVCSECKRTMSDDECGDEFPEERVCDTCAGLVGVTR